MIKRYILMIAVVLISFFLFSAYLQKEKMPDFSAIDNIETKKKNFFQYLSPMIDAENEKIRMQRKKLISLWQKSQDGVRLTHFEKQWLKKLTKAYELSTTERDTVPWTQLKRRVDTVPKSLALVQAAVESAWGTSRFARQGKNLFGEHCVTKGCGIVPEEAGEDPGFEVEKFDTVAHSIQSYMNNLNTHPSYQAFRKKRQDFRSRGEKPDVHELAETLHPYSGRKHDYTRSLQVMLNHNRELIKRL